MGNSIFLKIIHGIIPVYKIAEDEQHLAFLDKYPLKIGHTLVIPKKPVNKIYDLKQEEFRNIMNFTYIIMKSIEQTISCKRVALYIVGFEIPHAHIHLVPIDKESDLDFSISRKNNIQEQESCLKIFNQLKTTYNKLLYSQELSIH